MKSCKRLESLSLLRSEAESLMKALEATAAAANDVTAVTASVVSISAYWEWPA